MEVWIGRNGERHGPYKEDDIRAWLGSGQVSGGDLGWYDGLADWQPLALLFPDAVVAAAVAPAPPVPPTTTLPQSAAPSPGDYAGFWKRVAAYILDGIVLYIPGLLISSLTGSAAVEATFQQAQVQATGNPQAMLEAINNYVTGMTPALLLGFVVAWMYYAFCESSAWQATIGKMALGMRVTDLQGKRLTLARSLARYPGMILSSVLLCIGFVMIAWTQRKQGLHDMLAGTLVLNGRTGQVSGVGDKSDGRSFTA